MPDTPRYNDSSEVPPHLFTESQLAELDLPRVPVGEPAATIRSRRLDCTTRRPPDGLHHIADTAPSPATAAELAARTPDAATRHLCADCGAHTERPLRIFHGRRLCAACGHIADLIAEQGRRGRDGADAVTWAAGLVGDPNVRYVHPEVIRGPAVDGPRPLIVAVRTTVADHEGATKLDVAVRHGNPAAGVPEGVVDLETGAARLREAVHGHRIVCWSPETDARMRWLLNTNPGALVGDVEQAKEHVAAWRGDVDPVTCKLRPPTNPGRADRLWLLVARMAAAPQQGRADDGCERSTMRRRG